MTVFQYEIGQQVIARCNGTLVRGEIRQRFDTSTGAAYFVRHAGGGADCPEADIYLIELGSTESEIKAVMDLIRNTGHPGRVI